MRIFLLVLHLLLTLVMISVILIQRGEDANAGSSSGYGAMPGSRSGKSLLTRVTSILAALFFANCIGMAIRIRKESKLGMVSVVTKEDLSNKEKLGKIPIDEQSGATADRNAQTPISHPKDSDLGQKIPSSAPSNTPSVKSSSSPQK
jgi:protein translocase SecG subunit